MNQLKKIWLLGIVALSIASVPRLRREPAEPVGTDGVRIEKACIVIDPGHGGEDPGKVAADGTCEKDINLRIAGYIKTYLEMNDISVIMTRETDDSVSASGRKYSKKGDLDGRIERMDGAAAAISVHQNSFPKEYVYGSQCFYFSGSESGQLLAGFIQQRLITAGAANGRSAKSNGDYYLLKKSRIPTVIVECGFLSNEEELKRLQSPGYCKKLAWEITVGILQYVNAPSPE